MSWLSGLSATARSEALRVRAHTLLRHVAEGKAQEFKLLLRGGEEEVTLIPGAIDRPVELGSLRSRHAPHIVARGERIRAEVAGERQQVAELHPLVAAHAGDRRLAAQVGVGEVVDHRLLEARLEVEHVVADTEPVRDAAGIVDVLPGAAGAGARPRPARRIELERDADHLVARFRQQRCGDRRIDAAGHGDHHARLAARLGEAEIEDGCEHGAHYKGRRERRNCLSLGPRGMGDNKIFGGIPGISGM